MDPTPQELATFDSILAVFKWLEMPDDVGTALTGAMGASDSLRSWTRIPDDRYDDTIKGMRMDERKLTPSEEGQVGECATLGPTGPRGVGTGPSAAAGGKTCGLGRRRGAGRQSRGGPPGIRSSQDQARDRLRPRGRQRDQSAKRR